MTIKKGTPYPAKYDVDNVTLNFSFRQFGAYLFEAFNGASGSADTVADHRYMHEDNLIQIFTLPDGPIMAIHNLKTDRVDVVRPHAIAADGSRSDKPAARESNVISFPGRPTT